MKSSWVSPLWLRKAVAFQSSLNDAQLDAQTRSRDIASFVPSKLKISTMTLACRLNCEKLKLRKIEKRFSHADVQSMLEAILAGGASSAELVPHKDPRSFKNSVIFKFRGRFCRNSVKIFCNGMLLITGPVKMEAVIEAVEFTCLFLGVVFKLGTRHATNRFCAQNFRVIMINSSFGINHEFDLKRVIQAFLNNRMMSYVQVNHAGIMVKVPVPREDNDMYMVSVIIFRTGKTIITGSKTGQDISTTYAQVIDVLAREFDNIVVSKPPTSAREVMPPPDDDDDDDDIDMDLLAGLDEEFGTM